MKDATYFLLIEIIKRIVWRGNLSPSVQISENSPAVIIGNHLGPLGPIGTACSIQRRLYPWVINDMVDAKRAANYLREDFTEPTLKLKPPISILVSQLLVHITVPLLNSLGGVAIEREDPKKIFQALSSTVSLLKQGKVVMIFPEDPLLELNPQTDLRPFMKGFTRLGEVYFQETGKSLAFYPIAIHLSRNVRLGEPVIYNPQRPTVRERQRIKSELETRIRTMYLQMEREISNS